MKFCVSNIALTAYDHGDELMALADIGLSGLEVAPSRVWRDTWQGLSPADVAAYRKQVEAAGLSVVGLHSLLFDQKDLGLFADADGRARVLDFMAHLSGVCRDLGGKTLIWGAGRWRGTMSLEDAESYAVDFFTELDARIRDHGTVFCFEPLGAKDSDFLNSVFDAAEMAERLDLPSIGVQLDAKGITANAEMTAEAAEAAEPYLQHVHVNEPDLGVLGTTGGVDHAAFAEILRGIGYDGSISIEQKMVDPVDPLGPVRTSAAYLIDVYGAPSH